MAAITEDDDLSPAPNYDPNAENIEIVLDGHLMKQSKGRHSWKKRYFVFCSDQQLSCFHRQGDSLAKSTFRITRESGCKISDLFIQRSSHKPYYCITISWPEDATSTTSNNTEPLQSSANKATNDTLKDDASIFSAPESPSNRRPDSPRRSFDSLDSTVRSPSRGLSPFVTRRIKGKHKGRERERTNGDCGESASSNHIRRHSFLKMFGRTHSYEDVLQDQRNDSDDSVDGRENVPRSARSARRHVRRHTGDIPSIVNMDGIGPPPLVPLGNTSSSVGRTNTDPPFRSFSPTLPEEKTNELDRSDHIRLKVSAAPNAGGEEKAADQLDPKNGIDLEKTHLLTQYRSNKKERSLKSKKRMIDGTKYAAAAGAAVGITFLTSGIGLVAGAALLGVTAAAGGTAVGAEAGMKRKKSTTKLTLASTDFELIKEWKSTLDSCLEYESVKESTWAQMFLAEGRKTSTAFFSQERGDVTKSRNIDIHLSPGGQAKATKQFVLRKRQAHPFLKDGDISVECNSHWVPLDSGWASLLGSGSHGLRIFREERAGGISAAPAAGVTSCTTMKAQAVINAQPLDAFMCLMSVNRISSSGDDIAPRSRQRSSFRVLEKINDHTDIIHVVWRELYLFPSMTCPRDFVLFRYWRYEPDGSYIICYESMKHPMCPPRSDYVRGDMHQVLTIAPRRKTRKPSDNAAECLMTSVVQVDPKGWIPLKPLSFLSRQGYGDAFGVSALLNLVDIRDAIDLDRFLDVAPDMYDHQTYSSEGLPEADRDTTLEAASPTRTAHSESINYDPRFANRERLESQNLDQECIESYPEPLPSHKWAEPDANSFLVRGPNYLKDKAKINAGASIGRLLAMDLVAVDKPIYTGLSTHPSERIQLALKREQRLLASGKESDVPPFIFVVNIVLPGPPYYHGVFYYAVDDMSTIDGTDGTGSSALCKEFLFGDSDEFRDKTFKMIPQIVQGNFMVRKAVGSTPAIMGTKLKQTYVRDKRFMEVILDCGSSSVATGVIRLSLGYAKTLMVDMAFLLEGHDASTLPERVFGCVRVKFPEFGSDLRKVEAV